MLVRPAQREYRSWTVDSRRWDAFRPRDGDVVVATYPKCGTTWMQRIVSLLIFQAHGTNPADDDIALDREAIPRSDRNWSSIRLRSKRIGGRSKPIFPSMGFPIFDEVKYIHVTRDGRDACISYHNHIFGFSEATLAEARSRGSRRSIDRQALSACAIRSGAVLSRMAVGQRDAGRRRRFLLCVVFQS